MAGMLPGVELARRRRTNHHSFETSNSRDSTHRHHYHHRHQQRFESSTTNMDETALKARIRLEEKLRGLNGTSRWGKPQTKVNEAIRSSSSNHINDQAQSIMVTERRGRRSLILVESGISSPQLDRKNSLQREEVCSICLEEFGSKQQVMNLPCSHRYHSDCLLPWLNAHSHCPYCRTHVNLDIVLKPSPPPTST